ncbi:MAG: arsenic efflux protein [Lachnospiraceae bacterium]|nr:arsenic efflux protein [Lachnospiraceae bacterium]
MWDVIVDSILDTLRIIPFLYVTYLLMEWLEHAAGKKMELWMREAKQFGPLAGGILGVIPQCGFSAAISSLYAGGIVTAGTLLAVFLSTSDEMLPIMIGAQAPAGLIMKILLVKVVVAVIAGFILDFISNQILGKQHRHEHIHELCEDSHCHCHDHKGAGGIALSALVHTSQIAGFILLASFILNTVVLYVGEDRLGSLILNRPVIGELIAGLIGLIPNCAASVVITELYLSGTMRAGAMLSGLLVGSGVGLLVLFRANRNMKRNFQVLGILYGTGVVAGLILGLFPVWG